MIKNKYWDIWKKKRDIYKLKESYNKSKNNEYLIKNKDNIFLDIKDFRIDNIMLLQKYAFGVCK